MVTLPRAARSSRRRALPLGTPDWLPARVASQVKPRVSRSGIASIQLQNVVCRTHERPFALYLLKAPQQELAEASGLLDLAKHRFDEGLAHGIHRRPDLAVQLAGHAVDPRRR